MDFSTGNGFLNKLESTAMSDIIFNLLIFFLLSSSFIVQSGIEVDLPKTIQPAAIEEDKIVVTIDSEGVLFVKDKRVEWEGMREELLAAIESADDKQVVVRADGESPFGRAVEIMDAARELGATGLAVATEPKERGPKQ